MTSLNQLFSCNAARQKCVSSQLSANWVSLSFCKCIVLLNLDKQPSRDCSGCWRRTILCLNIIRWLFRLQRYRYYFSMKRKLICWSLTWSMKVLRNSMKGNKSTVLLWKISDGISHSPHKIILSNHFLQDLSLLFLWFLFFF